MKQSCNTPRVLQYLLAGGLLLVAPTLLADPGAECSQEARDYDIPPEQAASYIDGCIRSRGGLPEPVPVEAPVTAADAEYVPVTDTEPMNDAPQPDDLLQGGEYGTR